MKNQLNQAKLIRQMSDKQLLLNLYVSQCMVLILAIISSFFLFNSIQVWFDQINWESREVFLFGVVPALVIVTIDLILMKFLPKDYYDDGGINEKIFRNRSFIHILLITLLVAVSEEMLFRGVIQHQFGYIIGSVVFALIHFRYLVKPVLLISIILISFYLGYMYEITQNLLVTMVAHFLVDFILALFIKLRWGVNYGEEAGGPS